MRSEFSNQWWAICDAGWDMDDGDVACKELGHPRALELLVHPSYDHGNRSILAIELKCTGWEKTLKECPYRNKTDQHCYLYGVARVKCGKFPAAK